MQINNVNSKPNFGRFYNISGEVEKNMIMNRAIIDVGGITPWILQTNNREERKERIANLSIFFALAFLAPIVNVPLANRVAMKSVGLTKSFFANNHKAIQISNEFLTDTKAMKTAFGTLQNEAKSSPFESLCRLVNGKKAPSLDIENLYKNAGSEEQLRQKLIKAKNGVLCSDLYITGITLGSLGFLNNYMTKKRSGKTGFSAELEMADEALIAKRASGYEKNKYKRAAVLGAEIIAISTIVPLLVKKGLTSIKETKFNNYIKKNARWMDYTKGIYMKRLPLFMGMIMNVSGLLLASRNKTEFKDWSIRNGVTTPVFLGGDIVIGGLLANASDKLLGTKITDKTENPNLLRKIFPKTKSIDQLSALCKTDESLKTTRKAATGIYWGNLALVSACLAYVVPYLCNKMIKTDVAKDVLKNQDKTTLNPLLFAKTPEVFQLLLKNKSA